MKFEKEGLFIGLVKFAFHIDGKQLFDGIFSPFLTTQHKTNYLSRLTSKTQPEYLYKPRAYRMFGSHGLAILALIDDYAFCSRIFNAGHIDVQDNDDSVKKINQYTTVVLTGSSETFDDDKSNDDYLKKRALKTFLLSDGQKKYPFIGIMRIKLN